MPRDDDDSDEAPRGRNVKNKELKKRIQGFGSEPQPQEEDDWFDWGSGGGGGGGDGTFMGWYDSARSSVNAMLDAVDDTVNAIADAVDDTIAAVIGDEDDEYPVESGGGSANRRGEYDTGGNSADTPGKKKKKAKAPEDTGERSGTDWPSVVQAICEGGDCEDFVLKVRSQIKNDFEEREVGALLADSLLNEVKAQGTLRILHVMQAVVSDDNLHQAIDVIRSRCATKLGKLQTTPTFSKIAAEVLGPGPAEEEKNSDASPTTATPSPSAKPPATPSMDLLDMATPTNAASSAVAAKTEPLVDLIGLDAPAPAAASSTGPIPAIAPPKAKANGAAPAGLRSGALVRAKWAGDGNFYPALVESVRGQRVNVQWVRRSANSSKAEKFVGDVGDDTTHESCKLEDVMVGAVSAVTAQKGNLLDLDAAPSNNPVPAVSAAPAAVPPSVALANTLASMASSSTPSASPASGVPGADRFAALGAGGIPGPAMGTAAWPPALGAATAPSALGMAPMGAAGYKAPGAGPANANFASFPAAGNGLAGGPAINTLGGGAKMGSVPPMNSMKGSMPPMSSIDFTSGSSDPPAKKDFGLGDAFELTGMR